MASVQLGFTLRTSSNVKTVHLLGSWDNYTGQLPLSKDSSKAGAWKGMFRFQGTTLRPGQRYWYYYIMDGYHVSHDPAKASTKEPTTGRLLNILDVPASASVRGPPQLTIPHGRSLSPSKIVHPKPTKHYASRTIREADYSRSPVEHVDDLAMQLEHASLYKSRRPGYSPTSSVGSGFSSSSSSGSSSRGSRGGGPHSPSSLTSLSLSDASDSSCRCNRFGITRSGKKVLLDCGGRKCGYSDDSSSGCSSETSSSASSAEEDESEDEDDEEQSDSDIENEVATRYVAKAGGKGRVSLGRGGSSGSAMRKQQRPVIQEVRPRRVSGSGSGSGSRRK